jgi:asparagine synthase (glutamine-hydrolysing)
MCGLAGILTTRDDLDLSPVLAAMRDALRHRGPDDEGTAEVRLAGGYRLGLANTRLAILDLSPAGHQPMADPASGSWLAYNGEIYNHQDLRRVLPPGPYRSTSDTETLLRGWDQHGDRLLASLRGMFAFALYDGRRRRLWLVRDRLGVKPLYAGRAGPDTWVFASELRALLASGLVARRLRPAAVEAYLAFGATPAPWTLLEGVESLLPAESWCFDLAVPAASVPEPRRGRYWRPPFAPTTGRRTNRAEAVERLRPVLREAAALRMLADVPVGVFLSGGIDSSGLVALLAHEGFTPHTFSVVFRDSAEHDESRYSRLVASQFGTRHTELCLQPADVLDRFDEALDAYDQPSIDGLNTYHIARATRQAGVPVALSGLGGDELFGGYPYFRLAAGLAGRPGRALAWVAHACMRRVKPDSSWVVKLGQVLAGPASALARYAALRQVMPPGRRGAVLGRPPSGGVPLPPDLAAALEVETAGLDPINAQSLLELGLYLANVLLRDTDQMSMAHALEVREPLLDHVLVETVAALSGPLKLAAGPRHRVKALLLEALPAPLPRTTLNRPKMGFVFPWERWLRHELRPRLDSLFADHAAIRGAGLNALAVGKVWEDFLAGRPGLRYTDVFCLSNLIHWARRHRLTADDAPADTPPARLPVKR